MLLCVAVSVCVRAAFSGIIAMSVMKGVKDKIEDADFASGADVHYGAGFGLEAAAWITAVFAGFVAIFT
jgi:hypothetical protein